MFGEVEKEEKEKVAPLKKTRGIFRWLSVRQSLR